MNDNDYNCLSCSIKSCGEDIFEACDVCNQTVDNHSYCKFHLDHNQFKELHENHNIHANCDVIMVVDKTDDNFLTVDKINFVSESNILCEGCDKNYYIIDTYIRFLINIILNQLQ